MRQGNMARPMVAMLVSIALAGCGSTGGGNSDRVEADPGVDSPVGAFRPGQPAQDTLSDVGGTDPELIEVTGIPEDDAPVVTPDAAETVDPGIDAGQEAADDPGPIDPGGPEEPGPGDAGMDGNTTDAPLCPDSKDCTGRECGPDPVCGESCGTCGNDQVCGMGGHCLAGDEVQVPTVLATGKVTLPEGLSVEPETLRVASSLGSAMAGPDGSFSIPVFEGGPQFVQVEGPDGNLLLSGFVSAAHPGLSARTTAAALAYFHLGAFLLPPDLQAQAATDLVEAPELDPVEVAVEHALIAGEPVAESKAVLTEVAKFGKVSRQGGRSLLVDPSGTKSGLLMDISKGINLVGVRNEFRRRVYLWFDRLSYVPAGGGSDVTVNTLYKEMEGPLPSGIGGVVSSTVDALRSLAGGKIAYDPQSMLVRLPVLPIGAESTKYRITAIGIGGTVGDLEALGGGDRLSWFRFFVVRSLVLDIVVPYVLNVVFTIDGKQIDKYMTWFQKSGRAKDIMAFINYKLPAIVNKAANGDPNGACWDLVQAVTTPGTFRDYVFESVLEGIAYFQGKEAKDAAENWLKRVTWWIKALDVLYTTIDAAIQAWHLIESTEIEQWDVTVLPEKASIDPPKPVVPLYSAVLLTAFPNVKQFPGEDLRYRWKHSGTAGYLVSPDGKKGDDFKTTWETVTFFGDTSLPGTDSVTVEVTQIIDDGPDAIEYPQGSITIPVEVTGTVVTITPKNPFVTPGSTAAFAVTLDPAPKPGEDEVRYLWSVTAGKGHLTDGQAGHLDVFSSDSPTATFTADPDAEGEATVSVEAFRVVDGVPKSLGKTETILTIGEYIVVIDPSYASVPQGGTTTLAVSISPDPPADAVLEYHWTRTGPAGALDVGDDYTGDAASVNYTAAADGFGSDSVKVEVFRKEDNGNVLLGTGKATVQVGTMKVSLTPTPSWVFGGKTGTLVVGLDPIPAAGSTVVYRWTNTALAGHLSDGVAGHLDNFDGSKASATFTANDSTQGQDTVSVEVLIDAEGTLLSQGKAEATVHVFPFSAVTITPTEATVLYSETQEFEVILDPPPPAGSEVVYLWKKTGISGHLTDGQEGHLNSFESAASKALYTPVLSYPDDGTITVTALLATPDGKFPFGSATAVVMMIGYGYYPIKTVDVDLGGRCCSVCTPFITLPDPHVETVQVDCASPLSGWSLNARFDRWPTFPKSWYYGMHPFVEKANASFCNQDPFGMNDGDVVVVIYSGWAMWDECDKGIPVCESDKNELTIVQGGYCLVSAYLE